MKQLGTNDVNFKSDIVQYIYVNNYTNVNQSTKFVSYMKNKQHYSYISQK